MAFVKDKTGVRQTATNAAMNFVTAFVGAGLVTDVEEARNLFQSERDAIYTDLEAIVDADNKVFAENESKGGSKGSGGYKKSGSKSGGNKGGGSSVTLESSLGTELNFGAFKGCTLDEVSKMSAAEAEEYGYGGGEKNGMAYIKWLSTNENNDFIARRAKLVLESKQASSAEEAA